MSGPRATVAPTGSRASAVNRPGGRGGDDRLAAGQRLDRRRHADRRPQLGLPNLRGRELVRPLLFFQIRDSGRIVCRPLLGVRIRGRLVREHRDRSRDRDDP